ncbi:MAG: hypothetical protein LHW60_00990 [Candidatus Cloacimonetes bacterium]|jgi:hypothetical protein|nr:hypothetical protein [Candidatus Cloacimonadota bacterium]NLO43514.1 hypothetical protein [Candidatus Cloacimonadota bacterium]
MKKYILLISIVLLSGTMLFGYDAAQEEMSVEEAFSRGLSFFEDKTVKRDYRIAAGYFEIGADIWDEDSMLYLALSLLNINEDKFLEEAFYWMSLAYYFGAEHAEFYWDIIKFLMTRPRVGSVLKQVDDDLLKEGYKKGAWEF